MKWVTKSRVLGITMVVFILLCTSVTFATVNVTYKYYTVIGKTHEEILESLEKGAKEAGISSYYGKTNYQPYDPEFSSYKWVVLESRCDGDICTAKVGVKKSTFQNTKPFVVEITVILPEWTSPAGTSEIIKEKWKKFIEAGKKHEDGHVNNLRSEFQKIEDKFKSEDFKKEIENMTAMGQGKTREEAAQNAANTLEQSINDKIKNEVQAVKNSVDDWGKKYDGPYDKEKNPLGTNHGEMQGAVWCSRQQPSPNQKGGPEAQKKEKKAEVSYDATNKILHFDNWEIGGLAEDDPLSGGAVSVPDFRFIGPEGTGFLFSGIGAETLTISDGGNDYIKAWTPFLFVDDVVGPNYGYNMFAVLFDMNFDYDVGSAFIDQYTDFLTTTNFGSFVKKLKRPY